MRSIILFNSRDKSYSVVGTNYSNDECDSEVANLREQGLPAQHLDQAGKHFTESDVDNRVNEITKGTAIKMSL